MTTPKQARAQRKAEQAARHLERRRVVGDAPPPSGAPVDPNRLLRGKRKEHPPDFVVRGFYLDHRFECIDCGVEHVWSAWQQKRWYESFQPLKPPGFRCTRCRKEEFRRVHHAALLRKYGRLDGVPISSRPRGEPVGTSEAPRGKGNARRRKKLGRKPQPDWRSEETLDI